MKILSILMTKKNYGIMASAQYENPPWQRGKCITEHQSRFMRKTTLKEISQKISQNLFLITSFSTLQGIIA
jgi:hypothetical protein